MLMTQSSLQSDPRVMCGLIAKSTLAQLDMEDRSSAVEVFVRTLLNLLNAYRHGALRAGNPRGVGDYTPFGGLQSLAPTNLDDQLIAALDRTRVGLYPDLDKAGFVQVIGSALSAFLAAVLDPAKAAAENLRTHIATLRNFLEKLIAEIKVN